MSQPLMPLYGLPYGPYPTMYSPGVVYAHPAVPLVASPLSKESLSRSSENIDQVSTKKFTKLDEIAVPVGNDSAESVGIDASSDGSDGKAGGHQSWLRSNSMEHCSEVHVQASTIPEHCCKVPVDLEIVKRNSVRTQNGKAETSVGCAAEQLPFEVRLQEEWHLKRERRKQENRDSARRSRLRKQAETKEVMERYEFMKVENLALKSELTQLTQHSEKVRLENAALMEKLNNAQEGLPKTLVQVQIESNSARINITDELPKPNNSHSVSIKEETNCDALRNTNS